MMRSDITPSLPQAIFLFCVPFLLMISSVSSSTISQAQSIHLGNETDRLALLAIKDALYKLPRAMSSWNESTHFCEWEGVTCAPTTHQRVVVLNLRSQGLVGPVSPYIGNLSFLRYIGLENNTLQGNIPQEIGHLYSLEMLRLDNNSFVGQIPINLVRCTNLVSLFLNYNHLVGEIPSEFGSFTKLLDLYVWKNQLTGRIPVTLGNISSLQYLDMGDNHLEGSIPHSLGRLKELKELGLHLNRLSGKVPPSIYNLSALQVVGFFGNRLRGSLPPTLGRDFPDLRKFFIGKNQFSGTLPASLFSNVSQLSILDASGNSFVGQVPIEVGNLKKISFLNLVNNHFGSEGKMNDLGFISSMSNCSILEFFSIASNQFGGKLPASLANLSVTIKQLFLSDNQISGSIPFGISKLKNLFELRLSYNSLTGHIPKEIGILQKLQSLDLGHNRLTGKIPNTVGNITLLFELGISHNMLQGNVVPSLENCQALQKLFLDNNRFTGSFPKQIAGLQLVDMSNNYLNGSIPQEVGQLKNLRSLNLFGNELSGEIPTTLDSCFSLTELNLSDNSLQGPIPSSFGSLVAIESIDLSQNNLSGEIPRALENLHSLRYLNISFNNFEGEVPNKGIFQDLFNFSITENNKLCGGSNKLKLRKCHIKKSNKNIFPLALKVTIGVLVSLSVISTLLVFLILHFRKKSSTESSSINDANELQRISYSEIRQVTNEFSSSNLIGIGRFASVYRGVLRECGSVIAVKVFNLLERGASKSFKAECEILRKIRHRNLLKILTVCSSVDFDGNGFKALILEFMPYGSLEDWLHPGSDKSEKPSRMLDLQQRLNIAVDIASALDYLHNSSHIPIVHCDLKPSNVLLNKDFVARVADFGLAKFLSQRHSSVDKNETCSNIIRGTVGYIPPEYGMGSAVSTKGDVYSYGIMLLEMFTGRRPTDEMFSDNLSLHNFCKVKLVEQEVDMLNTIPLTKQFQNDIKEERSMPESMKKCLLSVIGIGVACSSEAAGDRMEIKDALMKIEKIKEIFLKSMNPEVKINLESHV